MWIDSHCHLDASEFGGVSLDVAELAARAGVSAIIIPAVHRTNFKPVAELARQREECFYALGIHPMYVPTSEEADLWHLREKISSLMAGADTDRKLVAIGEIGLDFFLPELAQSPLREKQEYFYIEQLKLARDFDLPVLLHVRRSQDTILKHLRRIKVPGGIAHAFNGSMQQARAFIELGFKLGFGGAMTFTRALQIRRLAVDLPLNSIVLETDAPDIPPSWLSNEINTPAQLPRVGQLLAELRNVSTQEIAETTSASVMAVLSRMRRG